MATTSPINGLPVPDDNSPNDPPIHIGALANQLDTRLVARFANAADRSAKITAPVEGMVSYLESDNRFYRHDGSGWQYAGGAPPPIVLATVLAGWTASAGRVPTVYKDASGLVHVNGGVLPGSTYNAQDGGTHTAVQLPTGYRPSINVDFLVLVPSQHLSVVMRIGTDGIMNVLDGPTSVSGSANHYLDGISFHPGYAGGALA